MVEDLPAALEMIIDPLLLRRPGGGVLAVEPRVRVQADLPLKEYRMTESPWTGTDFQFPPPGEPGIALCGACARQGACRLGLGREELLPDGSVETELVCGPENEGGPGVAHGGWIAGVFDEVTGHVPLLHGQLAVTGQLSVRYVKPVPIGRALQARAWTERKEGRRWYVAGELTLASTGAVLATGEAVMVLRDLGHFARHQKWLAEQDAQAGTVQDASGQDASGQDGPG